MKTFLFLTQKNCYRYNSVTRETETVEPYDYLPCGTNGVFPIDGRWSKESMMSYGKKLLDKHKLEGYHGFIIGDIQATIENNRYSYFK